MTLFPLAPPPGLFFKLPRTWPLPGETHTIWLMMSLFQTYQNQFECKARTRAHRGRQPHVDTHSMYTHAIIKRGGLSLPLARRHFSFSSLFASIANIVQEMSEMHLGHWRERDLDGGSLKKVSCSLYTMPVSSNAVPRHNVASVWQIDRNFSLSAFCLVEHKSLKHSVLLMREQAVPEGGGGVCIRSEIGWDPGQQSRVTGNNPFKSSEHDIWEWQSLQLCVEFH